MIRKFPTFNFLKQYVKLQISKHCRWMPLIHYPWLSSLLTSYRAKIWSNTLTGFWGKANRNFSIIILWVLIYFSKKSEIFRFRQNAPLSDIISPIFRWPLRSDKIFPYSNSRLRTWDWSLQYYGSFVLVLSKEWLPHSFCTLLAGHSKVISGQKSRWGISWPDRKLILIILNVSYNFLQLIFKWNIIN